jgi:hypothetical protein
MKSVFLIAIVAVAMIVLASSIIVYESRNSPALYNYKIMIRDMLVDQGLREQSVVPSMYENEPIVYHTFLQNITIIENSRYLNSQNELPDSLIIESGHYQFEGRTYNLTNEGLYRFINPSIDNQQRIVYDKNLDSLLSSFAWIYSHGNSDNSKNSLELTDKAMESKLFATCGGISKWVSEILESQNIKSRMVSTLTLDTWNTYNNGHTMIEVFRIDYDKWVLYDLDNNAYFERNKIPLSLIEFVNAVKSDDYTIKYLANDIKLDISNFKSVNNVSYSFWYEMMSNDEKSLKDWYKRVIQVPIIKDKNGDYYFSDIENKEKLESYSKKYQFMNNDQFINQFYSD